MLQEAVVLKSHCRFELHVREPQLLLNRTFASSAPFTAGVGKQCLAKRLMFNYPIVFLLLKRRNRRVLLRWNQFKSWTWSADTYAALLYGVVGGRKEVKCTSWKFPREAVSIGSILSSEVKRLPKVRTCPPTALLRIACPRSWFSEENANSSILLCGHLRKTTSVTADSNIQLSFKTWKKCPIET